MQKGKGTQVFRLQNTVLQALRENVKLSMSQKTQKQGKGRRRGRHSSQEQKAPASCGEVLVQSEGDDRTVTLWGEGARKCNKGKTTNPRWSGLAESNGRLTFEKKVETRLGGRRERRAGATKKLRQTVPLSS